MEVKIKLYRDCETCTLPNPKISMCVERAEKPELVIKLRDSGYSHPMHTAYHTLTSVEPSPTMP